MVFVVASPSYWKLAVEGEASDLHSNVAEEGAYSNEMVVDQNSYSEQKLFPLEMDLGWY